MTDFARLLAAHFAVLACCGLAPCRAAATPPNIIQIVADDVGWDDIGCYGAQKIKTPNLDNLAREGRRFTSFYAPAPLCSASRAALMTGCYAERVGIPGALMPHSQIGLSAKETTIAELLKSRGYATACVGKWHLGHQPQFLPHRHGFDLFFGIPYPNDQGAERNLFVQGRREPVRPPIRLLRNDEVVEHACDLERAPVRFLNEALRFIESHKGKPFFLHFSNIETHVPWYVPAIWQGRSAAGPYGDAVEAFDWSVGQIVAMVDSLGLGANTLIVFQSDNGMLIQRAPDYETHFGRFGRVDDSSMHRLRGSKHTVWEGGVRVACIARWPGQVPADSECGELTAGFDWYPTFAQLAGAELQKDCVIDGCDITPLLRGEPGAKTPHEAFLYYHSFRLGAVRSGKWKLMLAPAGSAADKAGVQLAPPQPLQLFDLDADPAETTDLTAQQPDVVQRLLALAQRAREDLGDSSRKLVGKGARPPGRAED